MLELLQESSFAMKSVFRIGNPFLWNGVEHVAIARHVKLIFLSKF